MYCILQRNVDVKQAVAMRISSRFHLGSSILPQAAPYIEAAVDSPSVRLRQLGAEQLGRLISLTQELPTQQNLAAKLAGLLRVCGHMMDGPSIVWLLLAVFTIFVTTHYNAFVRRVICCCKMGGIYVLQDSDGRVASAADRGLQQYACSSTYIFASLLDSSTPVGEAVRQLVSSADSVVRLRVFALLVASGSSSTEATHNVKSSGGCLENWPRTFCSACIVGHFLHSMHASVPWEAAWLCVSVQCTCLYYALDTVLSYTVVLCFLIVCRRHDRPVVVRAGQSK